MSWDESDVFRVMTIGGATAAVMVALVLAKPFYSATADAKAPVSSAVSQPVAASARNGSYIFCDLAHHRYQF